MQFGRASMIPLGFRVLAGVGGTLATAVAPGSKMRGESGILDRATVRPSRGHLSGRHSGGRTPGRNSEPALDREDKMAESKEPKCQPCAGTGKVPLTFDIVPGRMPAELMEIDCPKCGGTGRYTAPRFPSQRSQPPDRASHLANVANVYAAMRPYLPGAAYVNYCDLDLQNFADAYWSANLPRTIFGQEGL